MNVDDVRLLVQTVEARNEQSPLLLPATISSVNLADSIATVVLDGDPPDSTIDARTLIGDLVDGDRVMVMFDPPAGVYVTGRIESSRVAGSMLLYGCSNQSITITPSVFFRRAGTVQWEAGRLYRLSFFPFVVYGASALNYLLVTAQIRFEDEESSPVSVTQDFYLDDTFAGDARNMALEWFFAPQKDFNSEVWFQVDMQAGTSASIMAHSYSVQDVGPSGLARQAQAVSP